MELRNDDNTSFNKKLQEVAKDAQAVKMVKVIFNVPETMRDDFKKASMLNLSSMNAEIVKMIEVYLKDNSDKI